MGFFTDKKASDISYNLAKLGKDVLNNNSMNGGIKAAATIAGGVIIATGAVVGAVAYFQGKKAGKKNK